MESSADWAVMIEPFARVQTDILCQDGSPPYTCISVAARLDKSSLLALHSALSCLEGQEHRGNLPLRRIVDIPMLS